VRGIRAACGIEAVARSPFSGGKRQLNYRRAMTGTKRILADQCCGAIIDYQDYFLAQLEPRNRARLGRNMRSP
jgi:hypothetical protein